MPHRVLMANQTVANIRLMGQMFEQQVRIAQIFTDAALANNPFIQYARIRTHGAVPADIRTTEQTRRTRAPSPPPTMPATVRRTHSMPV